MTQHVRYSSIAAAGSLAADWRCRVCCRGRQPRRAGPAGRRDRQWRADHRARHRAAQQAQRSLSTHKAPPRQEVLDELINEKLKIKEGKRFGLEVTDFGGRQCLRHDGAAACDERRSSSTKMLAKSGSTLSTLKSRIRADMAWQQLVRGRYQSSLQIRREGRRCGAAQPEAGRTRTAAYDYTLRPILFLVPPGSRASGLRERASAKPRPCAAASELRGGLAFARALRDVAVRDQVIRSSADIPAELRKVLDSIEVGQLTPPEVTKLGIEMFAICGKKRIEGRQRAGQDSKAREAMFDGTLRAAVEDAICRSCARSAMIEYANRRGDVARLWR